MVTYKLVQNKNQNSKVFGKWFAKTANTAMTFDEFIEHMAAHHCVYSEATIRGVLLEMEICLREQLLEGRAVRFHELGIFQLGIENAKGGASTASEFNVARNIAGVRMNLYLGARFRRADLYKDAKFKEAGIYDVDSSKPTQGGSTESSTSQTGGGLPDDGD